MALRLSIERDGAWARLSLDRPKANVLDAEMVGALRAALAELRGRRGLKLVVLDHAGPHFSFGASVEEHLPGRVEGMLTGFHALFRELEAVGVPTAALVRGQCLGGGFELAVACGQVIAAPDAKLAVPEVKLGVFPPVAAALLPLRCDLQVATRMVLTGQALTAAEALAAGVVDAVAEDPEAALVAWYEAHLAGLSAVAVSFAWRAARRPVQRALAEDLPAFEALYLRELMATRDPVEGLRAFIERRPPQWEHA